MLSQLKKLKPDISELQLSEVKVDTTIIGYLATIFTENGYPYAGGCSEKRDTAIRIAAAECIERAIVHKIREESDGECLLLNEFPTTCGFAAGFDSAKTKARAICEAYERWAWSKWMDENYSIPIVEVANCITDPLSSYFQKTFDQVIFLEKEIQPELNWLHNQESIKLGIVLGIKGNGVFPGSRVVSVTEDPWGHALLEAWRHAIIFENISKYSGEAKDIFDKRIMHFGNYKELAFSAIERSKKSKWPKPKLRLLQEVQTPMEKTYLWRALCHDFVGWHEGPIDRFVY